MRVSYFRPRYLLPTVMLLVGLVVGGLLPQTSMHAVAVDRGENLLMATGLLDSDIEGVYLLDCFTGELMGGALGRAAAGFTSLYRTNVMKDFQLDAGKNPKFMMVTGVADLRGGSTNLYYGGSVIYIAELTTGKLAAYAVPWNRSRWNAHALTTDNFRLLGVVAYRMPLEDFMKPNQEKK